MKKPALCLCCLFALFIVACGGGNNMMMQQQPPVPFTPLNGSFGFIAGSQVTNTNTFTVGGTLQTDAKGNVSGVLGIASIVPTNSCFSAGTTASFTGMISQGRLTLTSAAINGQMVNLAVTVSSDGNFFSNGSFTVTGGCLNGDHGMVSATRLVTGAYTGTFALNGNMVNVTVNFNQPGIPGPDGSFAITAGATFTNNSACGFTSAGTESGAQSGLAVGFTMASNAASIFNFVGNSVDTSATMISGSFGVFSGPCDQMKGTVTLKKS
jgi:hypothetical protein